MTDRRSPTAGECAALLLETLPATMRILGGAMHMGRPAEGPPLNMGQLRMLEMLRRHPWTLGDLAERHHVAASTMSRTVDVLVRRQWVDRRSHPQDRRQVVLTLTEDGLTAHSAMRERAEELIAGLVAQLPEGDRARLYDGLGVLRDLAARAAEQGLPCDPEQRAGAPQGSQENKEDL